MKRILLISDVKGWGGWVRAQYIKKLLSDEFAFDLMDAEEFNAWEYKTSRSFFSMDDVKKYAPSSKDKKFYNFEDFKKFTRNRRQSRPYDLYYFLFHTMLIKQSVRRFLNSDANVVTIVTGFPTLKNIFYGRNSTTEKARKKFLNHADKCKAVFANNYKSLNNLRTIYDPRKTYYMPRGVDPKVFYPMTTEFKHKDENTFTIAYVGKPVPEKGLKEFIMPACEQASIRIIFNDRNYENALSPEEMNKFYNQADAYIVASTIDGTPNPALEAASCGKPIIANEIGNMPEFIKDGENGFLLTGEMKVNKYAQKLMWMKKNQKKTFEMGMNARNTIKQNWTWTKVVNKNERQAFRKMLL